MKNTRASRLAIATALLAVVPSAALARSGWQMKHFGAGPGFTSHSAATACPSHSKFATYTIRATERSSRGTLKSTSTVALTANHQPHPIILRHLGGSEYNSMSPSQRQIVFALTANELRKYTVAVISVHAKTMTTQLYHSGAPQGGHTPHTLHSVHC